MAAGYTQLSGYSAVLATLSNRIWPRVCPTWNSFHRLTVLSCNKGQTLLRDHRWKLTQVFRSLPTVLPCSQYLILCTGMKKVPLLVSKHALDRLNKPV